MSPPRVPSRPVISSVGVQPATASVTIPLPTRAKILIRNDFMGNLHLETFSTMSQRRLQAPAQCGRIDCRLSRLRNLQEKRATFVIRTTLPRGDLRAVLGLWWGTAGANAGTAKSRTRPAITTTATAACRPGLVARSSRRDIESHRWCSEFCWFCRCALTEPYLDWPMRTIRCQPQEVPALSVIVPAHSYRDSPVLW